MDEPTSDKLVDMSTQTEKESNGSDFSNSESTTENDGKTENKVEVNHDTQLPDDCSTPLSNSEPYPVRWGHAFFLSNSKFNGIDSSKNI